MKTIVKPVLKSFLTSVISAALLLMLFAFILQKCGNFSQLLPIFSIIAFLLSAMICGFRCAKCAQDKPFFIFLIAEGILLLVCLILLFLFGGSEAPMRTFLSYIGALASGIVGILLGMRKNGKKTKMLKKYKKYKKA